MSIDSGPTPEIPADVPRALHSRRGLLEPFGWYAKQRSIDPVQYDSDRGVYDVFRYQDVKRVFHSPETFERPNLSPNGPDETADDPLGYIGDAMIWSDRPGHDAAKQNMFEYFSPRALEDLPATVERIATDEIDRALEGGDHFDFVEDVAVPVTLKVPMALLGVPESDYETLVDWIETFDQVSLSEHSDVASSSPEEMAAVVEYFESLIDDRARNPRDDLISTFVHETPLDRELIGSNCFDMLFAGQGTMTDFLANAMYMDARQDIFEDLDPNELEPVLEEVLRLRSPIQCQSRVTTKSVTVGETRIPAGETVVCWIGSANRDPEAFDAPDEIVHDREADHLAFGHGSHSCIGFTMARLEAPIVLRTLFERVEELTVRESLLEPAPTPQVLAFDRFPVRVASSGK